MVLFLASSLFFTTPVPLEMPRAESYAIEYEDGTRRLEDRYNVHDLWFSRALIGRWVDDDFRVFALAELGVLPPALAKAGTSTRADYETMRVVADHRKPEDVFQMVNAISPVAPVQEFSSPRQLPRGCRDVRYYHGTNTSAVVCAFLPQDRDCWYLATWELADGDDFNAALETFEHDFLDKKAYKDAIEAVDRVEAAETSVHTASVGGRTVRKTKTSVRLRRSRAKDLPTERELLRADIMRNVAAYPNWHVADAPEFIVVDSLSGRGFVEALTNDMPNMRAKYAEAMPSPVSGSNTLCTVRIFADRDDYLEAVGEDKTWTAAYWSPERREIVAFLPLQGEAELLKTIRHEAFHQYLSYACSMRTASPWFNEGYAQYFENTESDEWEINRSEIDLDECEDLVDRLLDMDYEEFYCAGRMAEAVTTREAAEALARRRRLNYRLAWSIAYFIENGAPEIRYQPFKNLKRDYIENLLRHKNMRAATDGAFGSGERRKNFISEWKKFWLQRGM